MVDIVIMVYYLVYNSFIMIGCIGIVFFLSNYMVNGCRY